MINEDYKRIKKNLDGEIDILLLRSAYSNAKNCVACVYEDSDVDVGYYDYDGGIVPAFII